jgi:F0F1-type ATP synthase assembly protein I
MKRDLQNIAILIAGIMVGLIILYFPDKIIQFLKSGFGVFVLIEMAVIILVSIVITLIFISNGNSKKEL